MILTMLLVLIAAMAVSGCTTGSVVTPTVTPTAAPTMAPTAVPTAAPAPTAKPMTVAAATPAASPAASGGLYPTMSPWTPGPGISATVTPVPGAGYVIAPWIDQKIQVNPAYLNGPVVLVIKGNVKNPMNLTMVDLQSYPGISVNASYTKGSSTLYYNVTGASLNALLDSAQPLNGATSVKFIASDYNQTIPISAIRSDAKAIVAFDCPPDGSLRNILPSQSLSAKQWVRDLVTIQVQ